jgi:hypothetical protein
MDGGMKVFVGGGDCGKQKKGAGDRVDALPVRTLGGI